MRMIAVEAGKKCNTTLCKSCVYLGGDYQFWCPIRSYFKWHIFNQKPFLPTKPCRAAEVKS